MMLLVLCSSASALTPALDVSQYAHTSWKIRVGFVKGAILAVAQTPDGCAGDHRADVVRPGFSLLGLQGDTPCPIEVFPAVSTVSAILTRRRDARLGHSSDGT
jgi:hypothetical protein